MSKFRKTPVVIEAVQFWPDVKPWPVGVYLADRQSLLGAEPIIQVPVVRTLEGELTVRPGDWIIRGVMGEFSPCKPDIFEATYEPVPEATP